MNYFGTVSLFNGAVAFSTALYVLSKNRSNPIYVSFAVFVISVALWAIFYAIWQLQTDRGLALTFIRVAMAFCSYIPFSFLWFCRNLVQDAQQLRLHFLYIVIPTLFFLANFTPLMIPDVAQRLYFSYWPKPGFLMNIFVFILFAIVIYSFKLLFQGWFHASGMRRWQLRWVTIMGVR